MNAINVSPTRVTAARWKPVIDSLQKVAWAVFLLSLPVTSFPFLPPAIGGGALVRPLALYPLIVLMFLVTLPRLVTRPLPRAFLSLLPFVLLAIASSLLSLLRGIEPALDIPVTDRILRALLTLGIGCAIYLTVALVPRTLADLRSSLRWIYAGFGLALFWGSLQAIYVIRFTQEWFHFLNRTQRYISIRRLLNTRVSGMTYEPNWFAEQISFLLLPWLLASVLTGYTVFNWRWRRLTVETFLLVWSVAVLPFTFSRAGVLNLVVLAVLSILFFRFQSGQKAVAGSEHPMPQKKRGRLLRTLVEVGLVVAILGGLIFVAGTKNEFFARIWGYWQKKNTSLTGYFEYLGFGARFVYSEAAFRTYEAYPFLGVGLGNYAFYFDEMLPDRPLAYTPEILRLVTPEEGRNRLITAKNLYFRLLAETGLVGTAAFVAFLFAILGCALFLWLSPFLKQKFWGTAGLLGMIAFAMSALSFDSFAIPNMWVVFGLITAAAWVFAQSPTPEAAGLQNELVVEENTDRF